MAARTLAQRIEAGEGTALAALPRAPVRVRADNLVERPWGGQRLATYKGLALDEARAGARYGEAFEIAADPDDPDAAAHPSVAMLADGSETPLVTLLERAGEALLGASAWSAHGPRVPLLPKTLDVEELLSVQAHPPGLPELYVILDAEPGATLRLGFAKDVDPAALDARWREGRRAQERLLDLVREDVPQRVMSKVSAALRAGEREAALAAIAPVLRASGTETNARRLVDELAGVCTETLDMLHALPVRAGDVILNARPDTLGTPMPTAEIHALGNPEGRAMTLLEVRRPGATLRAWDHARFPLRRLDVDDAMALVSPRASDPDAYRVTPTAIEGRAGVARAVACAAFTVDLVTPPPGETAVPTGEHAARTLHVVAGTLRLHDEAGAPLGEMRAGESALVPAGLALGLSGEGRAVVVTVGSA